MSKSLIREMNDPATNTHKMSEPTKDASFFDFNDTDAYKNQADYSHSNKVLQS